MAFERVPESGDPRRLAGIVSGAATLLERLDERWVPDEQRHVASVCEGRFEQWRQAVAGAAPVRFDHRLAFLGVAPEEERLRTCVGPVRLAAAAEAPAWADALEEVMGAAAASPLDPELAARFLDPGEPVPFEDVLAPIVRWASGRLALEAGLQDEDFSPRCLGSLERLLLRRLSRVSAQALMHQLALFRLQRGFAGAGETGTMVYRDFCRQVSADGMRTLLSRYPMLARLLPGLVENWLGACGELAARARADRESLRAAFGCASPLGPLQEIRPGLSDPHAGGRTVAALTFENGLAVVYKPHDLGVVAAFSELLGWLNESGGGPDLRALRILPREGYGWMELAEHRPCQDDGEVRLYYRRAGGLLCLAYLLEGTDLHFENLIAAGAHPVLVDLEMLFHPPVEASGAGAQALARSELDSSVLRTGLLPQWRGGAQGSYDVSGLAAVPGQETKHFGPRWEHVNTDAMTLSFEPLRTPAAQNLPHLDGRPVPAWEHVEEIVEGLRTTYRALLDLREPLAAGPLSRFEGVEVRYVCRATQTYAAFLDELAEPAALTDGVSFGLVLEKLWQGFPLDDEEKGLPAHLADFEARALARRDVPRFRMRTDSRSLWAAEDLAAVDVFSEAGYPRMLRRLSGLCEADLDRQVGLLRAALFTRRERPSHGFSGVGEIAGDDRPGPLSREAAVEAALDIARRLEQGAVRAGRTATWISLGMNAENDVYQFQPMAPDLYSGVCGVAVFLAAAARVTDLGSLRGLALAALAELREDLRASDARNRLAHLDIGGASGLGSVVYGLLCCGRLLADPELLEDSKRAAELLDRARLAADDKFDVMRGAAGTILALSALHETCPGDELRRLVHACGDHLLNHRCEDSQGPRSWRTLGDELRTGFAHGAAGIAYGLLRAGRLCGEPKFEKAAVEAIAFEDALFSQEDGDWKIHAPGEGAQPAPMTTWCNGAPGIGLARFQGRDVLNTDQTQEDLRRALEATRTSLGKGADFLCCGELGRLELLGTAGDVVGRPELREEALRHAAWVVQRAKRRGSYLLSRALPAGVNDYSLFTGISGVGYQLLRLTHPEQLPSVLSWR
jgi:type 2 lantibiotic biosynthesis protein LanM